MSILNWLGAQTRAWAQKWKQFKWTFLSQSSSLVRQTCYRVLPYIYITNLHTLSGNSALGNTCKLLNSSCNNSWKTKGQTLGLELSTYRLGHVRHMRLLGFCVFFFFFEWGTFSEGFLFSTHSAYFQGLFWGSVKQICACKDSRWRKKDVARGFLDIWGTCTSPKFLEIVSVLMRARNKIWKWFLKKAATLWAVQYELCSGSTQKKV